MHFNDAILEYGFDCRARKLSDKTISNYQKQLRYFQRYLKINSLMVEKLENGVALENFPVQKKKINEKTSRERKLSEGMFRELTNAHKTDEEVFKIVSETADILQKIFQFQHPVEFLIENIKTKVRLPYPKAIAPNHRQLHEAAAVFPDLSGRSVRDRLPLFAL